MPEVELSPTKTFLYWSEYAVTYRSVVCLLLPQHCSAVMWNTAVNVNAWLVVAVCNKARGRRRGWSKKEGKGGEKERERGRGGKGADP